ncbi:unnamed protein product [Aphanomyces euteiches]|uniref:Uncharacterized protein n=1 Tax=Aphanomyces euteiches TaxID=100861 RepID=A0A6G0X935_9STRA|nr:hypothetical protein Ae201684_007054 [Aphanomyces euteiches]KAH9052515.1 hypothetical protein Ae201684P_001695 [Aphanomyces euteiches]KAH9079013.1 hypothetical protein Ae201684P_021678 [Aphanomyces euteiches]KAH9079023.1 hypothetical protein Ae201684P_010880 [Aphanomyces euteiches]
MGRSQLQFRRGRGRGGEGRGGRGRGSRQPDKPLESNAFRFKEEEDDNEEEDEYLEDDITESNTTRRDLRFNPDIQHMPTSISTGGAGHFQTKTMREWESENQAQGSMGLDFQAIGQHLKSIAPEKRFLIDAKYCIDLSFNPTPPSSSEDASPSQPRSVELASPLSSAIHDAGTSLQKAPIPTNVSSASAQPKKSSLPPAEEAPSATLAAVTSVSPATPVTAPQLPTTSCNYDDELDELLNM